MSNEWLLTSDFWQCLEPWHGRWYEYEIFIASCTDNIHDLGWPRVCRRSTSVLFILVTWWIFITTIIMFCLCPNVWKWIHTSILWSLKRTNKPKLWLFIICDIIRMMIISYGNYITETRMKCSLGSSVGSVGASVILQTLIYEIYITMDDI